MTEIIGYDFSPVEKTPKGKFVMQAVTSCYLCNKIICGHVVKAKICNDCVEKIQSQQYKLELK